MAGNKIYVQGSYIDVHNNENVYLNVDKAEVDVEDQTNQTKKGCVEGNTQEELIAQLKPIFYNNEDDVKIFLKEIEGMQPNNITDLVNKWVTDKRISDYGNSRKGELWEILSEANLYTKSRQNWCRRVY